MKNIIIIACYLIVQMTLFISAIFFDLEIPVKFLQYPFIVINFIFSLWLLIDLNNKDSKICSAALFFTLIADTFLVLIDNYKIFAMLSFSITQILYFVRLYNFRKEKNKVQIFDIIRIAIVMIVLLGAKIILKDSMDILVVLVCFYFSMLVLNFIEGIRNYRTSKLFIVGLILFIFCDILIGFANAEDYLTITEGSLIYTLLNADIDLAWLFYFPSQMLIVLSIVEKKIGEKNVKND